MNKKIEVNEETFRTLVEDVKDIRDWALGDKYHPGGISQQVQKNTDCVQKLRTRQTGFFAIIGGAWTAFTIGISLLIANMKN